MAHPPARRRSSLSLWYRPGSIRPEAFGAHWVAAGVQRPQRLLAVGAVPEQAQAAVGPRGEVGGGPAGVRAERGARAHLLGGRVDAPNGGAAVAVGPEQAGEAVAPDRDFRRRPTRRRAVVQA